MLEFGIAQVIVSGTLIAGMAGVALICDSLRTTNERLRRRLSILEALWEHRSTHDLSAPEPLNGPALEQARTEFRALLDRPRRPRRQARRSSAHNWNDLLSRSSKPIPIDVARAANQ